MQLQTLQYRIRGSFITSQARALLYEQNKLYQAIKILKECVVSDELSEADRLQIALDILDGKKAIAGTYPDDDYRIIVTEPSPDANTIQQWLEKQQKELTKLRKENNTLHRQIACVSRNLSSWKIREINDDWTENYQYSDEPNIFETAPTINIIHLQPNDTPHEPTAEQTSKKTLLERIQKEYPATEETSDSGWLAPDGTFYPVDYGEHEQWAEENGGLSEDDYEPTCQTAGDALIEKNWVKIHQPIGDGIPIASHREQFHPTKRQREFLYNFYFNRNMPDKANLWLE